MRRRVLGIAAQHHFQPLDGLFVVALIARDECEVVMRGELLRVQSCAFLQLVGGLAQPSQDVQHRAERVMQLRIRRPPGDERLEQRLGALELPLADLRGRERVLVRDVVRPQAGRPRERGLGVLQQIHLEADAAESEEDLWIVRRSFSCAHPVRERSLQCPLSSPRPPPPGAARQASPV